VSQKKAIIIGSGIGGLSTGIRLQAMGLETVILEKLDRPGGRAYQKEVEVENIGKFIFDMGPTVLTVPHFIEELFALKKNQRQFEENFTTESLEQVKKAANFDNLESQTLSHSPTFSPTHETAKYVNIVPILPYYRLYFSDGTFFDYDGNYQNTYQQILKISGQEEAENYKRFLEEASKVFKRGFLELGYNYFGTPGSMLAVLPDFLKLKIVRSLFSYSKSFFKTQKMQQVFSFETLLIGGNPYTVPAIYAIVHFVERTWGVHYAMGGTGSLIKGLVQKYEELGGELRLNSEVKNIEISGGIAAGVRLSENELVSADLVVSNADYAHTYLELSKNTPKFWNNPFKVKKLTEYSMSLFVLYFGFKRELKEDLATSLRHHNIIFGDNYKLELSQIFKSKELQKSFSQYLHIPTITDPSLAPKGYHTAYTLICVPNKKGKQNWLELEEEFAQKVIKFLDEQKYIPNLQKRLVHKSWITPDYFQKSLNSHLGNAFGVMPLFRHSAFFRPHNRSEDIKNLYLVGANTQPGAGTPSVMMSAKMTSKLIAEDLGIL
jgi:phytoene desaturase